MTLIVTPVTTDHERKQAYALRYTVFIDEQKFDGALEVDEYDAQPSTYHFLGKDVEQDKYVAAARCVVIASERKGKIGRVAVLSECRGKKYGVALMNGVESTLAAQCDKFVLSAQYDKVGFYEKCGYVRMDDEIYLDEGVEHCMMVKYTRKHDE